ncbi:hypothetical protein SIO70_18935 [Chitinophaga sancti]|uniref:hypothetical protein n=1 Tax=Chitinophaga sancti TaxID=1004 RepID=UPI002A75914C|nr:hypothetical protein [Chitinophaga sancti]WPQ60425.1 hypothetical protein SIO70_18935 [Chitinophaga sancti]
MKKILITASLMVAFATLMNSCKKDETAVAPPVPGNEFLTTVGLKVTNANDATDVQYAYWTDTTLISNPPDSINTPVLNLKADNKYNVEVLFQDRTTTPIGDVTAEIKERENYHLICFTSSPSLNLTVVRTDKDTNTPALEVGLTDLFTTGAAGTGELNVQLRHQPNVKDGTCEPGSTDADVNFTINIQ